MKYLMILPLVLSLTLAATSVSAQTEKELDCGYQSDVAGAVQQARLDGVPEREIQSAIEDSDPAWPARYSNAIPVFAAQVYSIKKRDLRKLDLRTEWLKTCMSG